MALAGIFGEEFPMTNREIETLLARAARSVRKGNGKVRNGTGEVRFSIVDYSEEEQQDYIDILRPFVGTDINRKEELYRNYLKEKGVHIPDEDADAFFRMAVRENKNEALRNGMKRRREEAYNYWMESNPLVKFIVEFTGSTDFTIKPTGFKGEDFSGSFIAPEYVKYSEKKPQGKRSHKQYRVYLVKRKEALDSASGHAIDELAEQYSRKTGNSNVISSHETEEDDDKTPCIIINGIMEEIQFSASKTAKKWHPEQELNLRPTV